MKITLGPPVRILLTHDLMRTLLLSLTIAVATTAGAQTLQNSSRSTTGYIKSDGTVQNSSRSTTGYIKSDGTVQNSSRSTIGYVKQDGTVQNSSRSTIGHASGVPREWAAAFYFFFHFN